MLHLIFNIAKLDPYKYKITKTNKKCTIVPSITIKISEWIDHFKSSQVLEHTIFTAADN